MIGALGGHVDAIEADYGGGVGFGFGGEDGADRDVGEVVCFGGADLFGGVGGEADHSVCGIGCFEGQVVLAEMDAVEGGVGVVVRDEGGVGELFAKDGEVAVEGGGGGLFVAELDEGYAGRVELAGEGAEGHVMPEEGGGVGDDVKTWQREGQQYFLKSQP